MRRSFPSAGAAGDLCCDANRRRVVLSCIRVAVSCQHVACRAHCTALSCAALQPENLLYESTAPDAPIKLADFGLAKIVGPGGGQLMHTTCGTPG